MAATEMDKMGGLLHENENDPFGFLIGVVSYVRGSFSCCIFFSKDMIFRAENIWLVFLFYSI